jgi:hypothetical protein
MLTDYYAILQLPKDATLDDVKRSYRRLARQYHPDVNHSADAQDKFIAITEAYEYLSHYLTEKQELSSYTKEEVSNMEAQIIIDEWLRAERERIRERARKHAGMHYSQFKKTDYYKTTEARQNLVVSILAIALGLFVMGGSVLGSIKVLTENDKLRNINYIGSTVVIFIFGLILTSIAVIKLMSSIKKPGKTK